MSDDTITGSSKKDFLIYTFLYAALHNPLWTADKEHAETVLENANVTEKITIESIGGYAWVECGLLNVGFTTKFEGTNKQTGKEVNGAVCSGIFSDYFVRFGP